MSYRIDNNDIVIDGWEKGIAASPHKGLANLQNVNISTENGEVMSSFNRVQQGQVVSTGTLTQVNTNTVTVTGVLPGQLITITNAGTTGLSGSYYYLGNGKLYSGSQCPDDPDNVTVVTGITAGTATFSIKIMGKLFQYATEIYMDSNGVQQARYFVLDSNSVVWCHDSSTLVNYPTPDWFYVIDLGSSYSGIAVYNGWLVAFKNTPTGGMTSSWRMTSLLNSTGHIITSLAMSSSATHYSLVGHQGKLYVTDGNYVASFFASTSLITGAANIQSYCEYSTGTYCNIIANIGGSLPTLGAASTIRIPVVLYSSESKPTAVSTDKVYYLESSVSGAQIFQFKIYAAATGGSALDMVTGASGRQFLCTFDPTESTLFTFTPQRVNLPYYETAQCLAELGNNVIIGGVTNTLYPWDQVSALPSDLIPLPENDVRQMVTVNNVLYVFAGQKGNVYITNGSSASLALSVPDYCAGIAGTSLSYIEPYFTWGGSMYCRGRVFFSIQDQTASKTGNCGGIWSFLPTQNFAYGQDTGLSLRLEHQNSYGTYNGMATILIPSMNQLAISAQFWAGWQSTYTGTSYGIDFTGTVPCVTSVIETDLIPTGTMLEKKTFMQLEYKLATPLATGESIDMKYRLNLTDAWSSFATANVETSNVSGYFPVPFQNTQWVQIQVTLTSNGGATSSFCRLTELRLK